MKNNRIADALIGGTEHQKADLVRFGKDRRSVKIAAKKELKLLAQTDILSINT